MKKLLCITLVLLMGVVPAVAGASEESVPVEHLLWGIPFGVSKEECIALAKELAGIELDAEENREFRLSIDISSPGGELTLLGKLASLYVNFDRDERVVALSVELPIYFGGNEKCLQFILETLEKARQSYGEALGGVLCINWNDDYSLPLVDGMPDANVLRCLFAKDLEVFSVRLYYDGAVVTFNIYMYHFDTCGLFVGISHRSPERTSDALSNLSELQEYTESVDQVVEQ